MSLFIFTLQKRGRGFSICSSFVNKLLDEIRRYPKIPNVLAYFSKVGFSIISKSMYVILPADDLRIEKPEIGVFAH
jgi:hypothetical protein